MEASSGQNAEKLDHTLNDTFKNTHSSISMLNAVVRRNQHARFTTMTQLVTFSLQSVCKTLTLTTTQLDQHEPRKYVVQQCRSAQVPTSFEERLNWFKVFEMISYLIQKMKDQTRVLQDLSKESSGVMDIDNSEFVCTILRNSGNDF
ncbi:hypothetical protein BGZ80_004220 [Entomortierella chlamydospora]|uniref:Uncharacterized protein n=1 Tax=Entomortierella chlamydospora TaxID=101097 RepID=A0A9P6SWG7_9FUNG|nr:hypothetical protein BGZ80_004220 [Entomortierella chlamydospora]